MADVLRLMGENVGKLADGNYYKQTWDELLAPVKREERSPEEIAADVIQNAGLSFGE